jgi:hypothetical protein
VKPSVVAVFIVLGWSLVEFYKIFFCTHEINNFLLSNSDEISLKTDSRKNLSPNIILIELETY